MTPLTPCEALPFETSILNDPRERGSSPRDRKSGAPLHPFWRPDWHVVCTVDEVRAKSSGWGDGAASKSGGVRGLPRTPPSFRVVRIRSRRLSRNLTSNRCHPEARTPPGSPRTGNGRAEGSTRGHGETCCGSRANPAAETVASLGFLRRCRAQGTWRPRVDPSGLRSLVFASFAVSGPQDDITEGAVVSQQFLRRGARRAARPWRWSSRAPRRRARGRGRGSPPAW